MFFHAVIFVLLRVLCIVQIVYTLKENKAHKEYVNKIKVIANILFSLDSMKYAKNWAPFSFYNYIYYLL